MTSVPAPAEPRTAPLDEAAFARCMAPFEPFEAAPHLAVALSGGADSMALCLLADAWARQRGGRVTALTVDHGLRPGSDAEAATVAGWMAVRGIEHQVLAWRGRKPGTGLQDAARRARYGLLGAWCRDRAVLHLLLGHHRDDQAETVLMRLDRDSGTDGLAGMAPIQDTADVRLLRPLLRVSPARLRATLERFGQDWIEDPSNRDPRFARVRLRQALAQSDPWLSAGAVQASSELMAQRDDLDAALSDLLAAACAVHPAGYAVLRRPLLSTVPRGLAERALARVLVTVGGGVYPPRRAKTRRLVGALLDSDGEWRGATLAGCRLLPRRGGAILVCREARGIERLAAAPGRTIWWDRRFAITLADQARAGWIGALGTAGWREISARAPDLRANRLPAAVRETIPALWDQQGVCAVPHLQYKRPDSVTAGAESPDFVVFRPARPLSGRGFCLAPPPWRTM